MSNIAPSASPLSSGILPHTLRMIRELNVNVLTVNKGLDLPLLCWYILRAKDKGRGEGRVPYLEAVELLQQLGLSDRTISRTLSKGHGVFFSTYSDTGVFYIGLTGLRAVLERLDCHLPNKARFIEAYTDNMPALNRVQARRAYLQDCGVYKPFGGSSSNHPKSRETIYRQTGIPERRQQRYDNAINALKAATYIKERLPNSYKAAAVRVVVFSKERGHYSVPQTINRYWAFAERGTRGQLREIARARGDKGQASSNTRDKGQTEPSHYRRYFSCFKALRKALTGHQVTSGAYPTKRSDGVYILEGSYA